MVSWDLMGLWNLNPPIRIQEEECARNVHTRKVRSRKVRSRKVQHQELGNMISPMLRLSLR